MQETADIVVSYGWLSLVPSLLAITTALITRQVYISLFLGILSGAWIVTGGGVETLPQSLMSTLDTYILRALVPEDGSADHLSILLFTLLTGGMIGIISANGGMSGVVRHLMRFASTRRRGQASTAGLGLLIFFDDYANTMIVGNTMRPLIDHLKVSREKLAFLVDATAAPIACVALVSTWFAFEASLIEDAMPEMYGHVGGFDLLLAAVGYSFYPLLMIGFVLMVVMTGRDFGPMLTAESKALNSDKPDHFVEEKGELHTHAANGMIPILTLIGVTVAGLLMTGEGDKLRDVLGSADPFKALLWGSLSGLMTAIVMTFATRTLNISETMEAMEKGFHPMLTASIILTLAWAIADVNSALNTAEYVVSMLGDDAASVWLPVMVFLMAAAVSFATGTSWGTMGILVPIVVPLSVAVLQQGSLEDMTTHPVMLATIASVLSGAVFGDHCSPISDTTVLSSLASGCPHMQHVITQLPYALTVAAVSLVFGIVPTVYGLPWWAALLTGLVVLYLALRMMGKRAESL